MDFETEIKKALNHMKHGLILTRYDLRKKPEELTFKVCLDTWELVWIRIEGKREGTVDLRLLKEIRYRNPDDKETKEFDKWACEAEKNWSLCFSLHYGDEFVLNHLSLQAQSSDDLNTLITGLKYLQETTQKASYNLKIERWLHKEFYGIKTGSENVTFADIQKLARSYYGIGAVELEEYFRECNVNTDGSVSCLDFTSIYHRIVCCTDLPDHFRSSADHAIDSETCTAFTAFLRAENHEEVNVESATQLMRQLVDEPMRSACNIRFSFQKFINYLFSTENSVWDEETIKLDPNMNQPLSHYFIASSHNTYLQGHQFVGNSSTEAYIQSLRMGARCIELDCWDGRDGSPRICHGYTWTSSIDFVDVVKGIKKYAWLTSEYPIILSIENRCSPLQQQKMAKVFTEVLGDELLTTPIDMNADKLPSPNQLKRKFIIKGKKLTGNWKLDNQEEDVSDVGDISPDDIRRSKKAGVLYLQDPLNNEEWNRHFLTLTNTGLYFTDQIDMMEDDDVQNDTEEDDDVNNISLLPATEVNRNPESTSKENEPWLYDDPYVTRSIATQWLATFNVPGYFLVRRSTSNPKEYAISHWYNGKAEHYQIKCKQENGSTKYYWKEMRVFDSLSKLIEHYKKKRPCSSTVELLLLEPVPKIPSPKGRDWYHEKLDRRGAEEWLGRVQKDGAFLIRTGVNEDGDKRYVLSFRAENETKHCEIIPDHSSFCLGFAMFESLLELVSYYQKHPLYRNIKLRYAVNKALVDKCGQLDADVSIYGCGIYTQPNELQPFNIQCRALYPRNSKICDELHFIKGDIISNVQKKTPDWWKGDICDQVNMWFPSNHVEQLEEGLGSLQRGFIKLSNSAKFIPNESLRASTSDSIQEKQLYCFELEYDEGKRIKIATENQDEARDWMSQIENKENEVPQKNSKIAQEFSDLVIYCRSTKYESKCCGKYYDMSSLSETSANKICTKKNDEGKEFLKYNMLQISRIYPKALRWDSSNYDPVLPWSCGSQMVALNYQTPDKAMQINQGRFTQNGMCGYVLQPPCLNDPKYNPFDKRSLVGVNPMTISVNVLAGRHLFKAVKGHSGPFVEVEILGADYEDTRKFSLLKTNKAENALAPFWNQTRDFDVVNPDLAMIRFCVQCEDYFKDPKFVGQATIPVRCLKQGYRSVPLLNGYSEKLELSSLLVKISIVNPKESKNSDIYAALSTWRDNRHKIEEKLMETEDEARPTDLQQELEDVNSKIVKLLNQRRERLEKAGV